MVKYKKSHGLIVIFVIVVMSIVIVLRFFPLLYKAAENSAINMLDSIENNGLDGACEQRLSKEKPEDQKVKTYQTGWSYSRKETIKAYCLGFLCIDEKKIEKYSSSPYNYKWIKSVCEDYNIEESSTTNSYEEVVENKEATVETNI